MTPGATRTIPQACWACIVALGVGLSVASASTEAGAPGARPEALPEYVLKLGFLYNFAKYVEWPADALEPAGAPMVIGIVGEDPFHEDLERTLDGKTVNSRAFTIRRFPTPSDVERCHILFVPRSEQGRLAEILKRTKDWAVLTVGEDVGFARAGGTAAIVIDGDTPRLEVNVEAAEKVRLTIQAKLLRLATIVTTGK